MAVYINARFLSQPVTGVQRHAENITRELFATVIAERIGWRYSMTTLKDRVRQIRPEELPAGHH
jgi:hypothetical protein